MNRLVPGPRRAHRQRLQATPCSSPSPSA